VPEIALGGDLEMVVTATDPLARNEDSVLGLGGAKVVSPGSNAAARDLSACANPPTPPRSEGRRCATVEDPVPVTRACAEARVESAPCSAATTEISSGRCVERRRARPRARPSASTEATCASGTRCPATASPLYDAKVSEAL
jgi:hypothetical protein